MVEIRCLGFLPCHDLVICWTNSPDLSMKNQDICFLHGCTITEKIYFKLKQQLTNWLESRHFGLFSNQKIHFAKTK